MTIVVLWYREKYDELWCAADSRISNSGLISTDSGAKIFQIPIFRHSLTSEGDWEKDGAENYGFAYSGSSLAALNALALGSACTQNICLDKGNNNPISVEDVADIFLRISEHYIKDISSRRVGATVNQRQYFFESFIFGYCQKEKSFKAFSLTPRLNESKFWIEKSVAKLEPFIFYPIGSGTNDFVSLSRELDETHPDPGVMNTLKELLRREKRDDVGGYFQVGISSKAGFKLTPILENTGEGRCTVRFLGVDVTEITDNREFTIGFDAVEP